MPAVSLSGETCWVGSKIYDCHGNHKQTNPTISPSLECGNLRGCVDKVYMLIKNMMSTKNTWQSS